MLREPMYASSFGLTEAPFSISPDPRYLYMSRRHQEAMAHLRYGIQESGGFVLLTGEVGTGKTTLCRSMLEQLPDNVDVALILNPQISHDELLATLCDEIGVAYPEDPSPKKLLDLLNDRLIETFSNGRRTVLVIDEAQMLSREVLEQVRILTNLETTRQKLLQIILIGQPELADVLSRRDLRQLAQRITARYHLEPLSRSETAEYVKYRLGVAGCHRDVFTRGALRRLFKLTQGVPRPINAICDRAMLGAYSSDRSRVNARMVSRAAREVRGVERRPPRRGFWWAAGVAAAAALAVVFVRTDWAAVDLSRFMPGTSAVVAPEEKVSAARDTPDRDAAVPEEPPAAGVNTTDGAAAGTPVPAPNPEAAGASDAADTSKATGTSAEQPLTLRAILDSQHAAATQREALGRLLGVWRMTSGGPDDASCDRIESLYGLRCLRERGSWADLRSYNRAAALAMNNGDRVSYLVLVGLGPDRATIAGRGTVFELDSDTLQPYWDGEYLLLWRAPPRGTRTLAEHSEGVDVLWLRQALSRVPSIRAVEVDNTRFDSALKERVMTFQKSNDLRVDGVAGVNTIIRINSIVDPDVPRLYAASG